MTKDDSNTKVVKNSRRRPPRAGMGRSKGAMNKHTTLLKEATLMAACVAGEKMEGGDKDALVAFLVHQAKKRNNTPFMMLLGKVLPLQITGEDGGAIETMTRIVIKTVSAGDDEDR